MEVFAAYTAQTDHEVGRVLEALQEMDQLHNTLVFWEIGDNGASFEGTLSGAFNEIATLEGPRRTRLPAPSHRRAGRTEGLEPHSRGLGLGRERALPVGQAGRLAPGRHAEPSGDRLAGPDQGRGGIRTQFHHVIDIAPTVLEAARLPQPSEVNGVKQKPIEGVSMVYSFDDPKAAGTRQVQYFEMLGNRALYKDGWIATARHGRLPWQTMGASTGDFDQDKWELYNLAEDFSEGTDVSARFPESSRSCRTRSGSRRRSTTSSRSTTASRSGATRACGPA
jgi:arylsulfatase